MDNTNEKTLANSVEEKDVILPIGYGEGVDIFDASTWPSENSQPDGVEELANAIAEAAEESSAETEVPSANGEDQEKTDESGADNEADPATVKATEEQPTTRIEKVKTTIDHKEQEISVDLDNDLPELIQKAHGLDRTREKLNAITPTVQKTEMVTALLGYDSIDAMLDAAKSSYMETEQEKLISENVHPEVAKDMVQRKVKEIEDKVIKSRKAAEEKAEAKETPKSKDKSERDFRPEVAVLLQTYPEIHGKTIPNEVLTDSLNSGKSLTQAYTDYKARQAQAELDLLRKENKTLRQNAEAAKRAPVTGAALGGATETQQDDPFLKGFNR